MIDGTQGKGPRVSQVTGQLPDTEAEETEEEKRAEDAPKRPGLLGWRLRHPRAARGVTVATTVLAAVLVLSALLLPNRVERLSFGACLL